MELDEAMASEWEAAGQAGQGPFCWSLVLQTGQGSHDQLSDLINRHLRAKLDCNNDLVVLAEEKRYVRDIVMRVYICV